MARQARINSIKSLPKSERAKQFLVLLFEGSACCEGLEELAIECGIVKQVEVSEPCGKHCECQHHGFYDGMTCNKLII